MNTISIALITAIILIAFATWLSKPCRCPCCGTHMVDEWDEITDNSYKVCPECGYRELLN